jgi:hypothetical protein
MKIAVPLARAAAALALIGTPLVGFAAAAHADAPVGTGWWNFATRAGLPQPPAPPDVNDGDLLVQAGDPSGATTGSAEGTSTPSAVAAVRFTIPAGSSVGPLSFDVPSGATAMDVRAYATPDSWKPVQNGQLADAPIPNRSRYSLGVLTGTTLVFADINRLLPDTGALSVVILPGTTDRVVLRKPGPGSLTVTPGPASTTTSFGTSPPPTTEAPGPPNAAAPAAGEPGTARAPILPSTSPLQAPAIGGPADIPPVAVAPPVTAPLSDSPQPVAVRAPLALSPDVRTRYFAAAEAVLVLITFGLFGWGPFARLALLVGSGEDVPPSSGQPVRGVGRFSRPRDGKFVRL